MMHISLAQLAKGLNIEVSHRYVRDAARRRCSKRILKTRQDARSGSHSMSVAQRATGHSRAEFRRSSTRTSRFRAAVHLLLECRQVLSAPFKQFFNQKLLQCGR